ncbi:MAG TPA: MFS transporter [Chloroflexota bacterium]|nr:MFS transporter [Chloroflexota bacterium]
MVRPPFARSLAATSRAGMTAFRYPGYPTFWSANLAWNVARWMEQLAVGWLSVELTHSAFLVAMIGFYRSLPLFLLGIFGGVLGDRFERRQLLLVIQLVDVLVIAALAVLSLQGRLGYADLAIAEVIMGAAQALDWPSRRAITVDLVGREDLANAVTLDSTNQNLSRAIGPIASGVLIFALSPATALAILAGFYVVNALLIARLPPIPRQSVKPQAVLASLSSGFRAVLQDEAIVGVLLITVAMNLLFFPYQQLLPVIAVDVLSLDSFGLGLLTAADGFGSFVGTLVLATLVGRRRNGIFFGLGALEACLCLFCFTFARSFTVAALLLWIGGFGRAGFSAFQATIILRNAGSEMRSRAMGILTLAIGVGPFGQMESGAVAEGIGTPSAILANVSACFVLVALVVARYKQLRSA